MRIVQVGDQRDAGSPEARVVGGAGDVLAEFRRELAVHGRAVDADLLEHAAVHHRHHAAAARRAVWSVRCHGVRTKRPGARSAKGAPAGRASSSASNAAQISSRKRLEPCPRARFAGFQGRRCCRGRHGRAVQNSSGAAPLPTSPRSVSANSSSSGMIPAGHALLVGVALHRLEILAVAGVSPYNHGSLPNTRSCSSTAVRTNTSGAIRGLAMRR